MHAVTGALTAAPRVSFLIPAYNAERTIDAALDSLRAQTIADWEAIVVDDGSRDRTFARACRRARADDRIRIVRQNNAGASAARNTALACARGNWIGFLDSDDWLAPTFLETLLPLAEGGKDGAATVGYCAYVRVLPDGTRTAPDFCQALQDDPARLLMRRCEPAIHCVLVPRDLIRDVGGFDPALGNCEDWDLWIRLTRAGARFVGTPAPLAFYRMRASSQSTRQDEVRRDSEIVQRRARQPDARIAHPDPQYARALMPHDPRAAPGEAMSELLRAAAAGEEGVIADWLDDPAFDWPHAGQDAIWLAEFLVDTLPPGALANAAVRALIERADQRSPGFAALFDDAADRAALIRAGIDGAVKGRWQYAEVRTDRPIPPIVARPGVDALAIDVDRRAMALELPIEGALCGTAIAEHIIRGSSVGALLRQTGALRRPLFWTRSALGMARLSTARATASREAAKTLVGDGLRHGLRAVMAPAARAMPSVTPRQPSPRGSVTTIPVLLFSRVSADDSLHSDDTVHPEQLVLILQLLSERGYAPIALADLARHRGARRGIASPSVVLCFTDLESYRRHAHPIVERSGFSAELFVDDDELAHAATRRLFAGHRGGIGWRPRLLPLPTKAYVDHAGAARRTLAAITGTSAIAAITPRNGLHNIMLEQAGFAAILTPGAEQARLFAEGPMIVTIDASGAEGLGNVVECLRHTT